MSGRTVSQYILTCDGCGMDQGMELGAVEARGKAYAQGWRFPPKLTRRTRRESTRQVYDLCPACLPTFNTKAGNDSEPVT